MGALDGLAEALRELRRSRKLSQAELSERSGLSASVINRTEKGHQEPSMPTLAAWLDAMGASLGDLAAELDAVNGRTGAAGTPRPDWVSALTRAGLDAEILQAFALGALSFATPRAEADFVESARAVATDLARAAVENARATYQPKPSD